MSLQKAKQIREFASKSIHEKWEALSHPERPCYNPALYDKAVALRADLYAEYYLLREHREISKADRDKAAQGFAIALLQLFNRFLDSYKRKDGSFFRALADALDRTENQAWSKRERFIFGECSACKTMGLKLPTAGQLLRGWKICCGMMPSRRLDLVFLWKFLLPNTPPPRNIEEMKRKLRLLLPPPNKKFAVVQIKQIQTEAKNLGYILTKTPRGNTAHLPPVGIFSMVVERDNVLF
jgi:hypothetical protein